MTLALMLVGAALAACGESRAQLSAPPALSTGKRGAVAPLPLPALTGRVVDNADLLTPAQETQLTQALATTEQITLHQFIVVTLPSLEGHSIEAVGLALGNGWGIGRKGYDDGVLLIVAPSERKVRIEVGCGLETALTNSEAQAIIDRRILPRFRKGAMAAGIFRGSAAIIREIDEPGVTP